MGNTFNKFLFKSKARINIIIFIISLITVFIVFLKIIKINVILGIKPDSFLGLLTFLAFILSTIFIITLIPSYPLFFIVFKDKGFNFIEKLGLTIVFNLCFFILAGYFGFFFGIPLTALYFFVVVLVVYGSIVSYIIVQEYRIGSYYFLKSKNSQKKLNYENFSFSTYLKRKIPSNGILLIVFLILICIYNVVRFQYFFGTDPWLHIFISKEIVEMGHLPLKEYYGSLGLPIFGAVIHFFSGINFILIPKWFIFYTILLSALLFYNILMRIFKNKNLSLFGVFILEFASIGFPYMMYQYWPAHLAIILSLTIFFLLYVRLQNFLKIERPTTKEVFTDMPFYYIIITLMFITAVFTHVLTSLIFIISFVWIFLIYFVKDYKRGFDLTLLCGLVGVFFVFILFGLSAEHFYFLGRVEMPALSLALIFVILGISGVLILTIWRLADSMLFTTGNFSKTARGEVHSYYKTIEEKVIIPLTLSIIIVLSVFYYIGNLLVFNLPITSIFNGMQFFIFIAFALWGFIIFQKKPRGKLFLIWAIFFGAFFASLFLIDTLTINKRYWVRILYMVPPLLVIGFISYIYKLIKMKSISNVRTKFFIFFIIGFALCTSFFHEHESAPYVSMNARQVGGAQWYSEHTDDKNVIVTEFGFNYMFYYYDYPYEENDRDLDGRDIHYFKDVQDNELFDPDKHIDNGTNKLQELKEEYETDVIITLDDQYYLNKEWATYGYVSRAEQEEYYEMKYLNRIYSAKSEDGEENAYYWVI